MHRYTSAITERRKYNAAQRRIDLADAAIDLLGTQGSRGLTHPRLDTHAGLPAGTTSYYFRTRKALLHAVAERLTELDLADLSMLDELDGRGRLGYAGTLGLAKLVMLSGTQSYLIRTRARFEVILNAHQDPELGATMSQYGLQFYQRARDVVAGWYEDLSLPEGLVDERAVMVLTYISGVMTSFVQGYPVVASAEQLDAAIRHILHRD